MLTRLLMSLGKVHRATTPEEREAIFRFRYDVYVRELKYNYAADHERGRLEQEEDGKPYTTLLYTGDARRVTSCVRLRVWEPGQVPARDFQALSLELFPGIERLRVAQVGRLLVHPPLRRKLLLPALLPA